MNASATNLLNRMGLNNIKGDMTINDVVKMLHRGGSKGGNCGTARCGMKGGSRRRRKRRHTRKHRSEKNKKYTWPFW